MRNFFGLLVLNLCALSARADLLVGRVVDGNGVGVPGVNLDAIDLINGGAASLINDGTDANGNFSTTIDAGVYRVKFTPPPPPATTLLALELDTVVVSGTSNLGTLVLEAGVILSGRAVDSSSVPVAGLNLDVVLAATGGELPVSNDSTNAFGSFSLVVPTETIELQFRTDQLGGSLAPRQLTLTLASDTGLGDVVLQPGFLLSGMVERTNGNPVANADIDLKESVSGLTVFTPSDNTNSSGEFSLLVPAGTYDLEVCPRPSDLLVADERTSILVNSGTDLGILTLLGGVTLSGTVTGTGAVPLANVDIDVRRTVSGVAVILCNDNTNAAGQYSVVVPTGTFNVTFTPPSGVCMAPVVASSVVVSANTVRNAALNGPITATAGHFSGDGVNVDVITPVPVKIGTLWTLPVTLGHSHGAGGALQLKIRPATVNGPSLTSPVGGRTIEVLIGGPLLATLGGSHNGSTGGIPPSSIPANSALIGLPWACQYTVTGGGFADYSTAAFGVVGCP